VAAKDGHLERMTSPEAPMNATSGTIAPGPAPGPADGKSAVRAARLTLARHWPGARPWPLFSALGPVAALPTAPGLARAFTAMVLGGWNLAHGDDLGEVTALVVSELATNVVLLATGADGSPRYQADGRLTELWLRLMSDRTRMQVEVWDNLPASAGAPAARRPGADEEHGRGLAIVDQLSQSWGCDQIPGLQAKSVWALLEAR
jgi:hypothetical protein